MKVNLIVTLEVKYKKFSVLVSNQFFYFSVIQNRIPEESSELQTKNFLQIRLC